MKKILLFLFLFKISITTQAQMTVVGTGPTVTPAALVLKILGPNVNATNTSYTGSQLSKGRFYGASFDSIQAGIILSNGIVSSAIDGNASVILSDDLTITGDTTLDAMAAPLQTFDATKLEFDFTIVSDTFQIEFMYASEDYNDMVNSSYNDLIGIFVSGPGIIGEQNIALIPGSSTPINVNNINNGQVATGTSSGPCMNCQYYVDNAGGNSFAFDGYTVPLIAKGFVKPCQQYHIKIVIADVGDHLNNSAILIKEGSLKSVAQTALFADGIVLNNNDTLIKCFGDTVILSLSANSNCLWTTGDTTQSIAVIVPQVGSGPISYSAYITNPPYYTCFAFSPSVLIVGDTNCVPRPVISYTSGILSSSITDSIYAYRWYLNGVLISGPNTPTFTPSVSGCYRLMISNTTNVTAVSDSICISVTGLNNISNNNVAYLIPNPFSQSAALSFENPKHETMTLKIVNAIGALIREMKTNGTQFEIQKQNEPAGIYFYQISNASSTIHYHGKMIIEN